MMLMRTSRRARKLLLLLPMSRRVTPMSGDEAMMPSPTIN